MGKSTNDLASPLIETQQEDYQSARDAAKNKQSSSQSTDQSANPSTKQSANHKSTKQTSKQSTNQSNDQSNDDKDQHKHSYNGHHANHNHHESEAEDKRTICIKQGVFAWNEEDHDRLDQQTQSSIIRRLYSKLRPSRSRLSRAQLYGTNKISSTRYSVITFIPVMLFEKLAPWISPANFYFLGVAIMQTFPAISTTQGRPSILLPLFIVILISAVKDGLEDYGRAKQDSAKNNAQFKTLRNGHYKKIASKDLLVGDVVMVEDNQRVPADIVLLSSGISGGSLAHVDTKNLDGETNLKPKSVPKPLLKEYRSDWKKMRDLSVTVKCDVPNGDMRSFSGEISLESDSKSEPLSLDSFVLSDCLVRNTPWVIGLIVYSGEETKIRMNMKSQLGESRRKETRVFQMTKRIFVLMVVVQVIMCALAAGLAGWYQYNNLNGADTEASWYLRTDESVRRTIFLRFMTWFIQLHDLVPISLFVSLELVQFLQALFMQWDDQMRHFINGDLLSTRVNSSSLNEDLAQVSYIFSDKTGTLTENSMVFKKCIIGATRYGHGQTEAGAIKAAREEGKDLGKAMKEFQQQREEKRKEESSKEDEDDGQAEYKKHVEFDELDDIRSLLAKSKKEYGQIKGDFQSAAQAKLEEKEKDEDSGSNENQSKNKSKHSKDNHDSESKNSSKRSNDKHDSESKNKSTRTDDDDGNESNKSKRSGDKRDSESDGSKREKSSSLSPRQSPDSESSDHQSDDDSSTKKPSSKSSPSTKESSKRDKQPHSNKDKSESPQSPDNSSKSNRSSKPSKSAKSPKSSKSKPSSSPNSGKEEQRDDSEEQANLVREFMYCLCLNSSVFPKIKDEEAAGEESSDSDSDDEETGIVNIVVNPMMSAFNSVGEQAKGAVENLSNLTGMASEEEEDDESDKKSIDDGEAPEAEKQADQEDKDGYDDPNSGLVVTLEASSPDETALTSMAAIVGFELYARNEGLVRIRVRDFDENQSEKSDDQSKSDGGSYHFEDFEEVIMIDYNSKRKRMTVIVRPNNEDGQPSDKVKIYSKGADTAIAKLLADDDPYWNDSISPALADFGSESLRTLVYAYSEQDASFVDKYRDRLDEALKSQGENENGHIDGECSKDCKLCEIEQEIEEAAELKSLGCSGIEDKLQEGVPQALQTLLDAGIKVWVLTGDTTSTAINIAMSCNLIDSEMENDGRLFVLDKDIHSTEDLRKTIDEALSTIEEIQSDENDDDDEPVRFGLALHADVWKLLHKADEPDDEDEQSKDVQRSPLDLFRSVKKSKSPPPSTDSDSDDESSKSEESPSNEKKTHHKLRRQDSDGSQIIDDDDDNDNLLDQFFKLCSHCQSVIACRLDPKEKADIVDAMREREGKTCLAIGDGNNDALMIKHADLGIGIAGVEGTSAVASSDFALGQFRFLPRLLLVHGRLNHRRTAIMVNYIFYKTAIIIWALFLFGVYSEFSGQVILLDWMFQLHNLVYSSLPILVFAIFDYDFSANTLSENPEIYPLTRFKQRHMHFAQAFFARHTSNLFFSYWDSFEWILLSVVHGCICFFLCIYALNESVSIDPSGVEYGVFDQGAVMYTAVILTTNLMLTLFFGSWTWLHHVAIWGSCALYFAAFAVFSASSIFDIGGASLFYTFYRLAVLPAFWLIITCAVGACMIVTMVWQYGKSMFAVKEEQVWREAQVLGKLKKEKRDQESSQEHKISVRKSSSSSHLSRQNSTSRLHEEEKDVPPPYTGSLFSYTPSIRRIRASK